MSNNTLILLVAIYTVLSIVSCGKNVCRLRYRSAIFHGAISLIGIMTLLWVLVSELISQSV